MNKLLKDARVIAHAHLLRIRESIGEWWEYHLANAHSDLAWHEIDKAEQSSHDYAQYLFLERNNDFIWSNFVQTRRLQREARRLGIELPPTSDKAMYEQVPWELEETQPYYFTDKGFLTANQLLREARKERHQLQFARIAALTGIVGALTGLVVVFLNRF